MKKGGSEKEKEKEKEKNEEGIPLKVFKEVIYTV